MTLARIAALFDAHPWVLAKTMPENPHWYTLRQQWESQEDFEWAVQFIRDNGYVGTYARTRYKYLDVGHYFYWTMGSPVAKTILTQPETPGVAPLTGNAHHAKRR